MHVPINDKSPNNISKWQMGFNSALKGLILLGWKIIANEEHVQCDHRFASPPLANEPLHSPQICRCGQWREAAASSPTQNH
jgi:hypothetical protein